MNHEQWEALQDGIKGHSPGPWLNEYTFCHMTKRADATLAAAAPDLLAEVERLRGWLDFISENPRGGHVTYVHAQNALSGEEVPK